jgi:hypothetical protein
MDWFERLTGFPEKNYEDTRSKLAVEGSQLRSIVNGQSYGIGELTLPSLQSLRDRVTAVSGRIKVSLERGDVRSMHQRPEFAGALFQVASQFNLLEMTSEHVTPEDGVSRYKNDHTQGPACAIAAGAGTIYRNYFAPVGGQTGQTSNCQLNGLAGLGAMLSERTGHPLPELWSMQNGYALCSQSGLNAINSALQTMTEVELDLLRGSLCIGVHRDVEVTDAAPECRQLVSQAYCSALPVAYSSLPAHLWKAFSCLVLEAAYEATIWAALESARLGGSNIVLLTSLGGGAFGNDDEWIHSAIRRALRLSIDCDLDVRIVSYRQPTSKLVNLVADFS